MPRRDLPKIRREHHPIVGIDKGLNYFDPTTLLDERYTPSCEEVLYRNRIISKAYGVEYFASTGTTPIDGTFMAGYIYKKNNETEKFMVHSTTNTYAYNSTSELLECITPGVVVENCEDVWTVNASVTAAVDTDARKGTYSVKLTIASGFTTGIAAYENFASADLSSYTQLHFYIKSDIATSAGDLVIRLSEQNAGGTGASYASYNVPALSAGVWKEVNVDLSSPDADGGGTYPDVMNAVLSVSLVVGVDNGAQVVNVDDVMCTVEDTGDIDNIFNFAVVNDYYIYSNGIVPTRYWDMAANTTSTVGGMANLASKAMLIIGGRLCIYHLPDLPRRVQWTVVGGVSIPPVSGDWSGSGSGNVDLDSSFSDDVIMTALKLGDYAILYGEKTIVLQEYINKVDTPYAFHIRVTDKGTPSSRGAVDLGDKHMFLGWDNVYIYKGGSFVEPIGDLISDEMFAIIDPDYISRSFLVHNKREYEVRVYFCVIGSTTPDTYFVYSLINKSWSRGSRAYTGYGLYQVDSSPTWHSYGGGDATWDSAGTRWNDSKQEALAKLQIFGDSSGIVYLDAESTTNNADGTAVSSNWESKDFVIGDTYRRNTTYWASIGFEATGNSITMEYSLDLGDSWSVGVSTTLTSSWKQYEIDLEAYSPQIRFRFSNSTISETYSLRQIMLGYIKSSDRGL